MARLVQPNFESKLKTKLTRLGPRPPPSLTKHKRRHENERYRVPYALQTRSDAPKKDRTSRTAAAAAVVVTSLNSRLVDLVVLVVSVYVSYNGIAFSRKDEC